MRPTLFSALSGCIWAGTAWILLEQRVNAGIVGGILVSPLIGIAMGIFSKRFAERPILTRAAIALSSLYLAVALFGIAGGMADAAFGSGKPITARNIIEWVWPFVAGLTFTGYVLALWPLAYLNHSVIGQAWSESKRGGMEVSI